MGRVATQTLSDSLRAGLQRQAAVVRTGARSFHLAAAAAPREAPQPALALIDGSSYIYRYHYGYEKGAARLTGPDGVDTSIQHAFLMFLLNLIDPGSAKIPWHWGALGGVTVIFDGGSARLDSIEERAVNYRRQLAGDYKARWPLQKG